MTAAISLNTELLQKIQQALILTRFKSIEDFIAFLIEEKLKELERQKTDSIFQARGMLKGKNGGTALFMQDKQAEIEREYRQ